MKKHLKRIEQRLDNILQEFSMIHLKIGILEKQIVEVGSPALHFIKRQDYDEDKIWYNKRLNEMESKLTMKFYQSTEVLPILRAEFSGLLESLHHDLEKLKELHQ